MKPHIPPAGGLSGVILGSSWSSGKVMGEVTSSPPDITGCCIIGLVTTPKVTSFTSERTKKGFWSSVLTA